MNKRLLLISIISSIFLAGELFGIDTLEEAFGNMHADGYLRLGYQQHDSNNDISFGGKLHFETAPFYGIIGGVGFYSTNSLFGKNDSDGVGFFDSEQKAYSILAEAYLKGGVGNSTFVLGRQSLDTPFADSDDIGMMPNLFEAWSLINCDIPNTTLIALWIKKGSGVDFEEPEKFTKVNADNGIQAIGLHYEGIENTSLFGWFYNLEDEATLSYVEVDYGFNIGTLETNLALQYSLQNFEYSEDATIIGVSVGLSDHEKGLTLMGAYNKSSDGVSDNGFGGGPFFTNSEHLTLGDAGKDGEIVSYGLEFDVGVVGLNGLSFVLWRSQLSDEDNNKGSELDIVIHYDFNQKLALDIIHSQIDNSDISGDKFDNTRAFINYTF